MYYYQEHKTEIQQHIMLTMFVVSCVTTPASKSETSNKNNTILDYENDAITAKDDTAMMM